MTHRFTYLEALVVAIGIPAAAEEAPDRGALMQSGYTLVGDAESALPKLGPLGRLYLLVVAEERRIDPDIVTYLIANACEAGARSMAGVSEVALADTQPRGLL